MMKNLLSALVAAALAAGGSQAYAHGTQEPGKKAAKKISTEEKDFGREGDPAKVSKTIQVGMADTMRFSPDALTVKAGDTVKFVLKNSGKQKHEMVLGTEKELKEHAALMLKFPTMEHDAPYMAHVSAGKMGEIVWQCTKPGEYHYGCLIPGHFEAGMKGKITVVSN